MKSTSKMPDGKELKQTGKNAKDRSGEIKQVSQIVHSYEDGFPDYKLGDDKHNQDAND